MQLIKCYYSARPWYTVLVYRPKSTKNTFLSLAHYSLPACSTEEALTHEDEKCKVSIRSVPAGRLQLPGFLQRCLQTRPPAQDPQSTGPALLYGRSA